MRMKVTQRAPRNPLPPLAREPALRLTPGSPCPRCGGLVLLRDVVTDEGRLREHYCSGCSRTSNPVMEETPPPSRLTLTEACESQLERVVLRLAREADGRSCRGGAPAIDDSADIVVSRSTLVALEISTAFEVECQPDEPPPIP